VCSASLRRVRLSVFQIQALFIFSSYSLGLQINTNGLLRLPVIDKHDIRFTPLAVNGRPLQSWISAHGQDDYGFMWLGTTRFV